MNYFHWDYNHTSWIPEATNKNINDFLKTETTDNVHKYLIWLNDNHKDFCYTYRENIFPQLLEFNHFFIADHLLKNKIYFFNEKIAKSCSFNMAMNFKEDMFIYWLDKVKTLNRHDQNSVYSHFWKEFLCFQFLRENEIHQNIPNLHFVFGKVPFYILSEYDIVNGYLMKNREDFYKNKFSNFTETSKITIMNEISLLCGQIHPEFKSIFKEEFEQYPDLINIFEKAESFQNLQNNLKNHSKNHTLKNNIKKSKI